MLSLIAHDPSKRLNASQALCHPYFWPSSQRLAYLDDVANKLDRLRPKLDQLAVSAATAAESDDSSLVNTKSRSGSKASRALCDYNINGKSDQCKSTSYYSGGEPIMSKKRADYWHWGDVVHPQLLASVGRHRTYDLCSLPDLLRFLRNFNQHFADQTFDAIAVLRHPTLESTLEIQHVTSSMLKKKAEFPGPGPNLVEPSVVEEHNPDSARSSALNQQKVSPTAMNGRHAANEELDEIKMAEWRASVLSSTAKQRAVIEAYVSRLFPSLVVDLWSALGTDF